MRPRRATASLPPVPASEELIGAGTIEALARCLRPAISGSSPDAILAAAGRLDGLSVTERVVLVRDELLACLPDSYGEADATIRTALADPALSGWMVWPVAEAMAELAISSGGKRDLDAGLKMMALLTPRLTSEFALRRFLNADLERTLAAASRWAKHPDPHVRRLASEGTRPRLPWAKRVAAIYEQPSLTVPILDSLHEDDSESVRRSVANHLNDISRLEPELAIATAARWLPGATPQTERLVKHAMRTLVKQGEPAALGLMGFSANPALEIEGPLLGADSVEIGARLGFRAEIANRGPSEVRLAIDYVIQYRKANGSLAPKVFKLAVEELGPGERVSFAREQSFRQLTTRRHHPGTHVLELQVNGRRYGAVEFLLVDPDGSAP